MNEKLRTVLLLVVKVTQRILRYGLRLIGLVFLIRFYLQYSHSPKLDALWIIGQIRQAFDPFITYVGTWANLQWPSEDEVAKYLPLGLALGTWLIAALVVGRLTRLSNRFEDADLLLAGGTGTKGFGGDPLADSADSEQKREELLTRYREIEKALKTAARKQCTFLSIDVVGSTKMKTDESATAIAATFQAYGEMIKNIFQKYGAWKQSWTPDGVMICFLQPELAVGATQSILRHLKTFNERDNQLRSPFHVRCGINEGEVAIFEDSKLERVADHVIDVAGHMQKYAAEDSLWLSEDLYNSLADKSGFRTTGKSVDGFNVYEWTAVPAAAVPDAPGDVPASLP